MNRFIPRALALCLALPALAASASSAVPTVDALYEQGQHALTTNWRPLGKLHDAAVFLHKDVKKTDKGRVAVWRHNEYPYPEYFEKEHAYLSSRERMVIDCKSSAVGISDLSYYEGRFASGAVVGANNAPTPETTVARPDSLEERIINLACISTPRSKPVRKAKPAKVAADQAPSKDKDSEKPAEKERRGGKAAP